MARELKIDINKVKSSYETVSTLENCVSNHNFHNYFYDMEDYLKLINDKHASCIKGYKDKVNEINESVDKVKNKLNLLSDSLKKTIDSYDKITYTAIEDNVSLRKDLEYAPKQNLSQAVNNDSDKVIVPVPQPSKEQMEPQGLFPEGYDTTPIGLGIAAAGVTGAIGAVVIDSMTPKSYKRNQGKPKYEIDDNDINDYRDYKVAEEAEEKEFVSLKIDPSMTSYQAHRDKDNMKKFYDDDELK